MKQLRLLLIGAVLLSVVLGLPRPATADDAYKVLFRNALNARDLRQWGLAAALFDEALKVQDQEGELIRRQGTPWVPYLPHFYLGDVLYELDHYPEAFAQWQESLRQGALRKRNRRDIGRAVDEFESACPGRVAMVRRSAMQGLDWIGRLRDQLEQEPVGSASEVAATRNALDEQEAALRSVLEGAGESSHQGSLPCVPDSGKNGLAGRIERARENARSVDHLERMTADSMETLSRSESRLRAADAERALRKVDDALTTIRSRRNRGGLERNDGAFLRAQFPVRFAAETAAGPAGDSERGRELAFADYLTAVGYVDARRCREATTLLDRAAEHLDPTFSPPASWGNFRYVPFLQRARAQMSCPGPDSVARVTALRDHALELGRITSDEADEIDSWLRRNQAVTVGKGLSALLIGVSKYQHGYDALNKVPQDLDAMKGFVETRWQEPLVLQNPTAQQMVDAIEDEIDASRSANPDQRFLFYFSGHGETHRTRQGVEVAYLVPSDAPQEDAAPNFGDFLEHQVIRIDQFLDWARRLEVDQALFVFDSCFSGAVKGLASEAGRPSRFDAKSAQKPARMFIASGDLDQTVSAGSEFRETVVTGLSGCADSDGNGYVTGTELGDYVKAVFETRRIKQHPWLGKLDDPILGQGDFLLRVGSTAEEPRCQDDRSRLATADVKLWEVVNDAFAASGDPDDLELYSQAAPEHFFQRAVEFKLRYLAESARTARALEGPGIRRLRTTTSRARRSTP